MDGKSSKPIKKIKSKTPIPFEYYKMIPIEPHEREPIPPEKIREQLINQMTDMNEESIENMANIIIYLIMQVRDLSEDARKKPEGINNDTEC